MQFRNRGRELADERGAAVVEFAIVLPLLVMFLLGIVQFSLMWNRQQALHAAAREGGRVASIPTSTQADITAAVDAALADTPFDSSRVITISPNATQPCLDNQGSTVTVTVTADSNLDIPFWDNTTLNLTGKGAFRCE
jgi:Flp pilus assembly protein TadG